MPRGKGRANYKVGLLIEVVEEKLPQGLLAGKRLLLFTSFGPKKLFLGTMKILNGTGLKSFATSLRNLPVIQVILLGIKFFVASGFMLGFWQNQHQLLWVQDLTRIQM